MSLSASEKKMILRALATLEQGLYETLERLDSLEENMRKLWGEVKSLRENQEKLWEEVRALKENQTRLWEETKKILDARGARGDICPNCGAPVEPDAKYCWRCGSRLG
jgi:DNA repair exonuclease SbcCD ATPase subunit